MREEEEEKSDRDGREQGRETATAKTRIDRGRTILLLWIAW